MAVTNGIVYFEGRYHYCTLYDMARTNYVEPELIADMLLTVGLQQNEYGHWHYKGEAVYKNGDIIAPVIDTLDAILQARQTA